MKMLTAMMMMMLVQTTSAHDAVVTELESTWESTWELTLVTPERMIDLPNKYHSYNSCVLHGIEMMIHRDTTREFELGFVCEQEVEDDE